MENIITKIKKLIEKANSTDSIHESETFMLKAQQLLQQYNLDMSKVESHVSEDKSIKEYFIRYSEKWEALLMQIIAQNNWCQALVIGGLNNGKQSVIGSPNNVEIVMYLYTFFKGRLQQLAIKSYDLYIKQKREALEDCGFKLPPGIDKKYMRDYLDGGVQGIGIKMKEQKMEASKNPEMKSLMISKDTEVNIYLRKHYPNIGATSIRSGERGKGYDNGIRDGRNINVNQGVNGANKSFGGYIG